MSSSGGAVSQRPEDWWAAASNALAEVAAAAAGRAILGIGLSGQIGTHVLLDSGGTPLHDAVTWQDGRSATVLQESADRIDRKWLSKELDTWLPPGAAWPLVRMLWLSRAKPALFSRARWLAQPKDFLTLRLTGRMVSDPSSWRGIARPDGSILTAALETLGLPNLIPELATGSEVAGTLLPSAAARTGLPPGLPIFTGMNDLNCSLLGIGAVQEGQGFDVAGTSEHLGFITRAPSEHPYINSVPLHGTDSELYSVYGVTSNGGAAVEWASSAFGWQGTDWAGRSGLSGESFTALVEASQLGARGLLFLPYLRGERAPVWDANARGALVGLTQTHGAPEIARATLEGVALNLRQIRDLLPASAVGDAEIRATGGPTRMAAWNRIKADVLQTPIRLMRETNSAALGAAALAAIGSGFYSSSGEAAASMVQAVETVEPDAAAGRVYDDLYLSFCELYPSLADLMHHN
jgi:sugar (pentulose or hexulose) kinase